MKKISILALILSASFFVGTAQSQTLTSTVQASGQVAVPTFHKHADYYWLTCPDSAPQGCTLYITTVLDDGSFYTHADPAVFPGTTVNINHAHVVESMTALVQN